MLQNSYIKKQEIFMNNNINSNINKSNVNILWNNITSNDELIIKKLTNLISNPYQLKLNLINNLLNSDVALPIFNYKDVIKFFCILNPLNLEYNMGSNVWNFKILDNRLFIQNSISKKDSSEIFYNKYINLIKKILVKSNINFNYFEFKSKRFNKTKDIIFVMDIIISYHK
jgi:hypothetical protein